MRIILLFRLALQIRCVPRSGVSRSGSKHLDWGQHCRQDEARVDSKGGFFLGELPHGVYVVVVLRGNEVVHQATVQNYPKATDGMDLTFDLTR